MSESAHRSRAATVFVSTTPDGAGEVLALLRAYAEAGPDEAGNLRLRVSRDILDPTRFVICEEWATQEALDGHMTRTHTQALLAAFGNPALIAGTEVWQAYEGQSSGDAA